MLLAIGCSKKGIHFKNSNDSDVKKFILIQRISRKLDLNCLYCVWNIHKISTEHF